MSFQNLIRIVTGILIFGNLLAVFVWAHWVDPPRTPFDPSESMRTSNRDSGRELDGFSKNRLAVLEKKQLELLGKLKSGTREARLAVLQELARVTRELRLMSNGRGPDLPFELIETLGDPDAEIREAAAQTSWEFPRRTPISVHELSRYSNFTLDGKDAVAVLALQLACRSPATRKAAAESLGRIGRDAKRADGSLKFAADEAMKGGVPPSKVGGSIAENQMVFDAIEDARKRIDLSDKADRRLKSK